MLGKLFAHEWKDTWKLMAVMNAAVLVLSVIGAIFFHRNASVVRPLFDSLGSSDGDTLYFLACTGYFMLLVLSIAVLAVGCTIYFYIRFYRNLYTDQGYLMHTLPVSPHELILSKTFVCLIWRTISALVVLAGVLTLVVSAFGEEVSIADVIESVFSMFDDLGAFKGSIFMMLILLGLIGKALFTAFTGYTCISIGQLASKNKVMAAIGVYFGMRILMQILSTFGSQYFVILGTMAPERWMDMMSFDGYAWLVGLALLVTGEYLLCAAMYAIVHSIMQKRLNLE